jgi:hypothetical protein
VVIIRDPFPRKTNNRDGKEAADDHADDVAKECYEETSALGVVSYSFCDVIGHLYTPPSPNCGEEYPRPHQHDEDASQQEHIVGSGAKRVSSFRI